MRRPAGRTEAAAKDHIEEYGGEAEADNGDEQGLGKAVHGRPLQVVGRATPLKQPLPGRRVVQEAR